MSGTTTRDRYGATGNRECYPLDVDRLVIEEDDPTHPEHAHHVWRTSLDRPKMQDLLASIREHGTEGVARPIIVYLDGKVPKVAEGRRTVTAIRIVNAERKAARPKLPPLKVLGITTKDPSLARDLGGVGREEDPPMVLARRYRKALDAGETPSAAAARTAGNLAYANVLLKCLSLPDDVQAAINRGEIAPDVAVRAARNGGGAAAAAVVEDAKDPTTGKVDGEKAKAAAKRVTPVVRRSTPHPRTAIKIGVTLAMSHRCERADGFLLALRWHAGEDVWDRLPAEVQAALVDHGWGPERAKGGAT